MLTVIDIGCVEHVSDAGIPEESINQLAGLYHPDRLIGFDPLAEEQEYRIGNTDVELHQMAAWTEQRTLTFLERGMCSGVVTRDDDRGVPVKAFDLAELIHSLPGEVILKLDCEGSEYPILHHLIETDADLELKLTLVEWHEGQDRHDHIGDQGWILENFRTPMEKWHSIGGG